MTSTAPIRRVALLTAGGFAPCLSSAVAGLVKHYGEEVPEAEIIAYQHGYHGLLTGTKIVIGEEAKAKIDVLYNFGGSPIGNSRVKLTNSTAADLAAYLEENGHHLTVVGLPKTIDNDIVPIAQSLGAHTAAEQTSVFAQNIIGEHRSNPRMLIVHEIMGRHCGWLTAAA